MDLQPLLSPQGRLGRRSFVIIAAGLLVVGLVLGLVPVVGQLAALALAWPWTCVAIKRLHDMGRSGRVAVALMTINVLLALVSASVGVMAGSGALGLAAFALATAIGGFAVLMSLVSLAFVVWIAVTPSEDGTNRFGPPALETLFA